MDTLIGIIAGMVIGWIAHRSFPGCRDMGLRTALIVGLAGGALGAQLSATFGAGPSPDGSLSVASVIASIVVAGVCLVVADKVAARYGT